MNYIPVSEVEKLIDQHTASYESAVRAAMDVDKVAHAFVVTNLRRLLKSATEGVTIEGFQVLIVDEENGLLLDDDERKRLDNFNGVEGTLIFIPDKTVVTEGESFRRVEEKQ